MANPHFIWSIHVVSIISIMTVSARPNTMEDSLRLLQDSIMNMQKNFAGQLTGLGQGTITNFPFRVPDVYEQHQSGQGIPLGAFLFFNGIPNEEIIPYNNNNLQNQEPQDTSFDVSQNQRFPSHFGNRNHQYGHNHNQFQPLSDQSSASAISSASASSSSYGGNRNDNNDHPNSNKYSKPNPDSNKHTYFNNQGHPDSHNHEYPHRHHYSNNYDRHHHGYDHEYHNRKDHNQDGGYRPNFERYPNQDVSFQNSDSVFNPGNKYPRDRKHESENFNQFTTKRPNSNYRERNFQHGNPVNQPSNSYDRESNRGSSHNYQFIPNHPIYNRGPYQNVPIRKENTVYTKIPSHLDNLKPAIESIDDIVPPNIRQNMTFTQDTNSSTDKTATSGSSRESVEKTTTIKETKTVVKKTDGKVTSVEESGNGDQIYSIDFNNGDGGITDRNTSSVPVVPSVLSVPSVPSVLSVPSPP